MDILYALLGLGVIIVVGYFVLKAQQQKKREEQQVLAMQWKAENKVRMSDPILRSDIEILTLTELSLVRRGHRVAPHPDCEERQAQRVAMIR